MTRPPKDRPETVGNDGGDRYLRRRDLLDDGKRPETVLEWVIKLAADLKVQVGVATGTGMFAAAMILLGNTAAATMAGYFLSLIVLMILLDRGWERLESFYGSEEDTERQHPTRYEPVPEPVRQNLKRRESGIERELDQHRVSLSRTDVKVTITILALLVLIISSFAVVAGSLG